MKRYAPGLISGILFYLPLSIYAYYSFAAAGQLGYLSAMLSLLLGALYQAVPLAYLGLSMLQTR